MSKPRIRRTIALFSFLMVAALQTTLAGAATQTGSYTGGYDVKQANPDILGFGTATSNATWNNANGNLTVSASATSNAPAGIVYGVGAGGSEALANSYLYHYFNSVAAGARTISVNLNVTSLTAPAASSTPTTPLLYGLDSFGIAYATVGYSATWYETGDCQTAYPSPCRYASVYDYKAVTATGSQFTNTLTLDVPADGYVVFSAYVSAYAKATGQSSNASTSLAATVQGMTVS